MNDVRFLLHTNAFSERGDSVTVMALAKALKEHLGIDSTIAFSKSNVDNSPSRIHAARDAGLELFAYENRQDLEQLVSKKNITHTYVYSDGTLAGNHYSQDDPSKFRLGDSRHLTHAVFRNFQPHGDYYFYISEWLFDWSRPRRILKATEDGLKGLINPAERDAHETKVSWLPFFVETGKGDGDSFRQEHAIPSDAKLIGRIGGREQFDDSAAQQGLLELLETDHSIWAIFVNTTPFGTHQRLKYVDYLGRDEVWDFYAACNLLLNGRLMGESFGYSIVEPLMAGKPVIAPGSRRNRNMDKHHLVVLDGLNLTYSDKKSFKKIASDELSNPRHPDIFSKNVCQFTSANVMRRLEELVLRDPRLGASNLL